MKSTVDIPVIAVYAYQDEWDEKSLDMDIKILEPLGVILTEARQPDLHFPEALD